MKSYPIHHHHLLSFLSSWRMGPSIRLLQATRTFAATSASLHVLNPIYSLSLLIVLRHVSLGRPLRCLPSGAHEFYLIRSHHFVLWRIQKFDTNSTIARASPRVNRIKSNKSANKSDGAVSNRTLRYVNYTY